MRACVRGCNSACVRAYLRACLFVCCVRACARVRVRACVFTLRCARVWVGLGSRKFYPITHLVSIFLIATRPILNFFN